MFTGAEQNTSEPKPGVLVHESAKAGQDNLYGYDTETKELKFVAPTNHKMTETLVLRRGKSEESVDLERRGQTTPEGRFLVFSASESLAGDTNNATKAPLAVYRYDFERGELTWVSHAAPGFPAGNEGIDALVAYVPGTEIGAEQSIDDYNRAISGEAAAEAPGKTPEARHDGEYIIFSTRERLQSSDVNASADVYEWRCAAPCSQPAQEGVVSMISDGQSRNGSGSGEQETLPSGLPTVGAAAMSASGSDVFFFTDNTLVGQDRDVLGDLYDARTNGGFPAPPPESSCSGEQCQGALSELPSFGSAPSSSFAAGGNLSPSASGPSAPNQSKPKPKPATRAQLLAKALKSCKSKPRRKQAACRSQAKKRYASNAKTRKSGRSGK